jgi:hypothetical protein
MALDLTTPENQAELAKLIQSETDKVRTKYSGELKGVQDELAKLKLGQMDEVQRAKYEAETKANDLAAREKALLTKELDLGTKELLVSKGLKPELSALLTADTMEGRTAQLEVLVKTMNLQVKEEVVKKIGQDDPEVSNVKNEGRAKQYDFSKMTYSEKVELYQKDQKLYEQLASGK